MNIFEDEALYLSNKAKKAGFDKSLQDVFLDTEQSDEKVFEKINKNNLKYFIFICTGNISLATNNGSISYRSGGCNSSLAGYFKKYINEMNKMDKQGNILYFHTLIKIIESEFKDNYKDSDIIFFYNF